MTAHDNSSTNKHHGKNSLFLFQRVIVISDDPDGRSAVLCSLGVPVCDEGGGPVSNGEEEEKDGRGRVD